MTEMSVLTLERLRAGPIFGCEVIVASAERVDSALRNPVFSSLLRKTGWLISPIWG
jgi:hypothetical protein